MSAQGFFSEHWKDENDNPAGGVTTGKGFTISWQNGPLGRGNERREPNGAFVEDVIAAAIDRIRFYQDGKFASVFNEQAIVYLNVAIRQLQARTADRESRDVEGTHEE